MPKQTEEILKYIHGEKSLKSPFAIYLDLECLLKKEQSCQNNPREKSYTWAFWLDNVYKFSIWWKRK